jgi:ankyrin repeat protein
MEEYFRAIREGNEGEVVRLLDADPELLESIDDRRQSPLIAAAAAGHLGIVGLLIERGANINATGFMGRTALHWAGHEGREDMVALLLSKGAQANSRSENGATPLMFAAYRGHLGVVRMLVQHRGGVGLDERTFLSGETVLHYAAHGGHEEVVRYLLLAGCDPTIMDTRGRTPRARAQEIDLFTCVTMFEVRQHMCCTHPAPRCILLHMCILSASAA